MIVPCSYNSLVCHLVYSSFVGFFLLQKKHPLVKVDTASTIDSSQPKLFEFGKSAGAQKYKATDKKQQTSGISKFAIDILV